MHDIEQILRVNKLLMNLAIYFSVLGAIAVCGASTHSMLKDTTESRYKVGQIWSYETRPSEKKSSFIVLKVERHPKPGNVVHIALCDLRLKKPNGDFIETADHPPFAEDAINKSAVKLLKRRS